MKLTNKTLIEEKIINELTFKTKEGKEIIVEKYNIYTTYPLEQNEADYRIISGNTYYQALSDEEQDDLDDLINNN